MPQCYLVLQHYISNPEIYNIETLKYGKSQGLELLKPWKKQNNQKEFSAKGRYGQLYISLTVPLVQATTDRTANSFLCPEDTSL